MSDSENVWLKAEEQDENQRIDKYLARVMPEIVSFLFSETFERRGSIYRWEGREGERPPAMRG